MASVAEFPIGETIVQQSLPPVVPMSVAISSPNGTIINTVGNDLQLNVNENQDTFTLKGRITKSYRENLKKLGGRWDYVNKMWIFEKKHLNDVKTFIEGVKSGSILPDPAVPNQFKGSRNTVPTLNYGGNININIPTVQSPNDYDSADYQKISWSVFKPKVDQDVSLRIKSNGWTLYYKVTFIEEHNGILDTVFITDKSNKTSKLVIENGKWQVKGLMDEHSVYFVKFKK